ncbi:hypothetical protein [Streptomyces beihaiensis]|uniref:Uncharacterized protein n=1 Tax=Streptomyces beihaiensis TaxID=2984495 RepID=A0ABT3TXK5_9ACTN|nr:hypothetical protein [Streptomyces beihaiensis]MCX3061775.1 hypothetical protein [Streptomyces beihaiensis]
MIGNPSGIDEVDKRPAYSHTWSAADNQQRFMLKHGGSVVPRSDVKPGEILHFDQSGPSDYLARTARPVTRRL